MTELTNALKESTQKNENHKIINIALLNKQAQLQSELEKLVEESTNAKREDTKLQSEIIAYEDSIQSHEEIEANLKTIIQNKKNELIEQEEKFMQLGNPDYDATVKIEEVVKKKLDKVGKSIEETQLKRVEEINKNIEGEAPSSHEQDVCQVIQNTKSTGNNVRNVPDPTIDTDFRAIIRETRNDELLEESEKKIQLNTELMKQPAMTKVK